MKLVLLAIAAALICGCSASKKAAKYNEDIKRGISDYIQDHPCINDTITTTKTDTLTETQFQTDTAYQTLNDTVTKTITKKERTTLILHDTATVTVKDVQLINFWRDSASAANRTAQILQTKNQETVTVSNDWRNKARLRLYLLIAVIAAFGIWTFRKPLLALV